MSKRPGFLERISSKATRWTGSSAAFALAVLIIVVWAVTGPIFKYSDTWQLVINTGTTIVTFLMVFLIQRAQNKDSLVIQLKLNEIVAALEGASNRLINVEDLSEDEVKILHDHYSRLVELAKQDCRLCESHSIEDANLDHAVKMARRRRAPETPPATAKGERQSDAEPAPEPDDFHTNFAITSQKLVAKKEKPDAA